MRLDGRSIGAVGASMIAFLIALLISFGLGLYVRVLEPPRHERLILSSTESETRQPCAVDVDDRRSDLCAQWKAADAARSSADASWLFGAIGTCIGAFTLLAAGLAAKYARDAALEAKKAADAAAITVDEARHANAIARNIDRPWIAPSAAMVAFESHNGELRFKFEFFYKNVGRMAAESVQLFSHLIFDPNTSDVVNSLVDNFISNGPSVNSFSVIIPDGHLRSELQGAVHLTKPYVYGDVTPRIRIAILAVCRYKLPGDDDFRHSATSWYLRNNGPRSLLPAGSIARSPSIRLFEFSSMTVSDFELVRSRVSAS